MKSAARFLLAICVAFALMMLFRAAGMTLFTIEGNGLCPDLQAGDRVLVNRWSYGLRVGGSNSIFGYGRLGRQQVERGDLVAFNHPADSIDQVFICRCLGLPGDTLCVDSIEVIVPSLKNCADGDYYWMESVNPASRFDSRVFGFVPEEKIIGRACLVVCSHDPSDPIYCGWLSDRFLLPLNLK